MISEELALWWDIWAQTLMNWKGKPCKLSGGRTLKVGEISTRVPVGSKPTDQPKERRKGVGSQIREVMGQNVQSLNATLRTLNFTNSKQDFKQE